MERTENLDRDAGIQLKDGVQSTASEGEKKQEDVHMGEPGFLHKLFRRKKLEGLFLFVTSQCNSKCRTCFYHDKLNDGRDMSFEQIKKISETAPNFDKLWLSGGEPFMRKELVEIIQLFYANNNVRVINLPTNGLLTDRIVKETGRLLELCPDLTVHINFSLDGPGKVHDDNRGIPGNFIKTITTMGLIKEKYGKNPHLLQNVATVITPDGYDSIFELGTYLIKKDLIATNFFEVVRGDPKDKKTKGLTPEQLKALRKKVFPLIEAQADNLFRDFSGPKKKLAKFFFIGFIRFVNEIQDANFTGPSDWKMRCVAGETTIVLDHNGDFRSCEMRPPIGNMKDYDYNLSAALFSDAMKKEIDEVGGGWKANCWCTHGCWVMSSIKFSPRAILFRIPGAYFRSRKDHVPGFELPEVDTEAIENYRS